MTTLVFHADVKKIEKPIFQGDTQLLKEIIVPKGMAETIGKKLGKYRKYIVEK